jgi:hypothetical protein
VDTPLLILILAVSALVLLDVAALRFGANSRRPDDDRPDWW